MDEMIQQEQEAKKMNFPFAQKEQMDLNFFALKNWDKDREIQEGFYQDQEREKVKQAVRILDHSVVFRNEQEYYGKLLAENNRFYHMEEVQGQHIKMSDTQRRKLHENRMNGYLKAREKYGEGVTANTIPFSNEIKRYQKLKKNAEMQQGTEWTEILKNIRMDASLFDTTYEKGRESSVDIAMLLSKRDSMKQLIESIPKIDMTDPAVTAENKFEIRRCCMVYTAFCNAVNALLVRNRVDETGNVLQEEEAHSYSKSAESQHIEKEAGYFSQENNVREAVLNFKKTLGMANERLLGEMSPGKQEMLEQQELTDAPIIFTDERRKREYNSIQRICWEHTGGRLAPVLNQLQEEYRSRQYLLCRMDQVYGHEVSEWQTKNAVWQNTTAYIENQERIKRLARMIRGITKKGPMSISMRLELEDLKKKAGINNPDKKEKAEQPEKTQKKRILDEKKRARREEEADKLEALIGYRKRGELSLEMQEEYKDLLDYIYSKEAIERKKAQIKLEEWIKTECSDLQNYFIQEQQRPAGVSMLQKGVGLATKGKITLDKVLRPGLYAQQFQKMAGIKDNQIIQAMPIAGTALIHGNALLTDASILTGTALNLYGAAKALKEKEFKQAGEKGLDLLVNGAQIAKETGLWMTRFDPAKTVMGSTMGAASGIVIGGLTAARQTVGAVNTGITKYHIEKQKKVFEKELKEGEKQQLEEQEKLERKKKEELLRILNTSGRVASVDIAAKSVLAFSGVVTAAGAASLLVVPAAVPVVAGVTVANMVLQKGTMIAANNKKASIREDQVENLIQKYMERAKNHAKAQNEYMLSERDIRRALLKYAGAKTGEKDEAALMMVNRQASMLVREKENKDVKATLKAMGMDAGKISPKSLEKLKLKLGMNQQQAKNTGKALNDIRKKELERVTEVGLTNMDRAWRWIRKKWNA